jgi:hypothetical protein
MKSHITRLNNEPKDEKHQSLQWSQRPNQTTYNIIYNYI